MKVRDRIETIVDLFLGALHADHHFDEVERRALRTLLCNLICRPTLPDAVERRIEAFDPARFDLRAAAAAFAEDPPMHARRLLELAAELCNCNGEFDMDEDEYLHQLGRALGLDPLDYEDILLDYEVQELAVRPPPRTPARAVPSVRPPPRSTAREEIALRPPRAAARIDGGLALVPEHAL